jgi:hypothetical protein
VTKINWARSKQQTLMAARGTEPLGDADEGDAGPAAFMRVMCAGCSHIGSVPTSHEGFISCKRCGLRQRVSRAAYKMRQFRRRESRAT